MEKGGMVLSEFSVVLPEANQLTWRLWHDRKESIIRAFLLPAARISVPGGIRQQASCFLSGFGVPGFPNHLFIVSTYMVFSAQTRPFCQDGILYLRWMQSSASWHGAGQQDENEMPTRRERGVEKCGIKGKEGRTRFLPKRHGKGYWRPYCVLPWCRQ